MRFDCHDCSFQASTSTELMKHLRLTGRQPGKAIQDIRSKFIVCYTEEIVRKANGRLQLLRKVSSFGADVSDLKLIYVMFIRSLLEQSCTVWHSGLTEQNTQDLERIQKTSFKIILKDNYMSYENALKVLDLETLSDRRENLCLSFARKCLKNERMSQYFEKM